MGPAGGSERGGRCDALDRLRLRACWIVLLLLGALEGLLPVLEDGLEVLLELDVLLGLEVWLFGCELLTGMGADLRPERARFLTRSVDERGWPSAVCVRPGSRTSCSL